jgi:hypothetical protein
MSKLNYGNNPKLINRINNQIFGASVYRLLGYFCEQTSTAN